jgi:hypothetical protein
MSPLGIARGIFTAPSGASYEGTDVSADLLWHMQNIETDSFSTTYDITTANGYESNGVNVNGTTYAANMIVYDGNQTWGSGSITGSGNKLVMNRINGNLTVSSGFTATTSGACNALCIYVDGDLTVNGSISTYDKGREISGGVSTSLTVNSSENEVGGSSTIALTGSANAHTNGVSTASAMTTGGGGQGGSGSYGSGTGASGHIFSGGSGGGGSGGVAYYNHYQGGGGSGGTATANAGDGGNGGASGYTHWGYWTGDAGGSGGTGNPGGSGGSNNSRNASDSRAGYTGNTGTPASLIIYATGNLTVASGGTLSTAGRSGRSGDHNRLKAGGGGGSGGGVLVAVCGGTYTNSGTVTSAGGSTGAGRGSGSAAGSGGKLTGGGYA